MPKSIGALTTTAFIVCFILLYPSNPSSHPAVFAPAVVLWQQDAGGVELRYNTLHHLPSPAFYRVLDFGHNYFLLSRRRRKHRTDHSLFFTLIRIQSGEGICKAQKHAILPPLQSQHK
jgi:hypothetical protein